MGDRTVSRRHTRVERRSEGVVVEDLGSRNGTKINDEYIYAPALLRSGDRIVANTRCPFRPRCSAAVTLGGGITIT